MSIKVSVLYFVFQVIMQKKIQIKKNNNETINEQLECRFKRRIGGIK